MTDLDVRVTDALSDRYRIERELGAGGMATVYLAEDLKHSRKVAIKVLREDLAASMGSARFLREIQIAAQLQHPNILPLLDSGDADGFLYYVMPYVSGQSLRQRIAREGELPVHEAVRLTIEIVDALAHAHEHGVVHRDIKPDNVMLSGRHALVTDFGVAKAISEATGRNTITTLGVAVGTPAYMSPEQAAADPHVDHRSDLYSVGVVAYELLAGRPPFTGAPQQVLAAHTTEVPDPVSKRRSVIPPALELVVMKCLAKRPADRWQTAAELLAQLEPLATPSTGITPAQTRPTDASVPTRPRRLWRGLALAGAAIVVLAGLAWRKYASPATRPYDRIQVTTTGNASSPVVSPDGRQVAYTARTCTDDGTCTSRLMVQDLGTGTAQPIEDSLDAASLTRWSASGSWLSAYVTAHRRGMPQGFYVVSHLGGAMTRLGLVGDLVSATDTALVTDNVVVGRDTVRLRRLSPPWSQATDSILLVPPPGAQLLSGFAVAPSSKWLAMFWITTTGYEITIHDRAGRQIDRRDIDIPSPSLLWSPTGSSILLPIVTANQEGGFERVAVDQNTGRMGLTDTLSIAASRAPAGFDISRDGSVLAYTLRQAGEHVLWTLATPLNSEVPKLVRRVRGTSSGFEAGITPDGQTILFNTTAHVADGRLTQWFAAPFLGGPERPVTPPLRGVFDITLTVDSRRLLVASLQSGGRTRLTTYDLATGAVVRSVERADTNFAVASATANEIVISSTAVRGRTEQSGVGPGDTLTFLDTAGRMKRRIIVPDSLGHNVSFAPSPDGDAYAFIAPPFDRHDTRGTARIFRLALGTGEFTLVGPAEFNSAYPLFWTSDGWIRFFGAAADDRRLAMYRVRASGGTAERREVVPFPDGCDCDFSADGRRGVAVTSKLLTDIWLIRNFNPSAKR